ncbi:MAG: biotin transporter BioY [Acidimicrobiia bacterium]|nr:biotin transporter BioY [Acidimicrobiia bacterium]
MQSVAAARVISGRVVASNRVAAIVAMVAFAGLTALAAQIRIPLGFTPVPITGQTFAVLLAGAALGARLGAGSQLIYLAAGAVGLPVFTGGGSGVEYFTGATAGYLVGFVLAAALVGRLAERGQDRKVNTAITAFLAGSAIIYACGAVGLMITADMDLTTAIAQGVTPFVFGDVLKATAAGMLLPLAWKLRGA